MSHDPTHAALIAEAINLNNKLATVLATVFAHNSCATVVFVWFLQVMSHVAAAQSASVVFLCIHRENYDFLETIAHQLSGKVPRQTPLYKVAVMPKH